MVHVAEAETVAVDFAVIKGPATHRASGFLNTISADLPADQPEDRLIRLLRPKLFRLHAREALTPSIYRRLTGYEADIQSVISDAYGYPGPSGIWPVTEETGRDGRIWPRNWYERLIQRGSNSYGIFGTSRITINFGIGALNSFLRHGNGQCVRSVA